jgi:hypothetical protein
MPPNTSPTKLLKTTAVAAVVETTAPLRIGDTVHNVIEIKARGDVILDVTFSNTEACTKSIPSDLIQKLRTAKEPFPSTRLFYRVHLETLKKASKYFTHLLGSDVFGEGRAIKDAFAKMEEENVKPSEIEAERLPRINIEDEDDATKIMGREHVFRDMLRIIHGAGHLTKPVTLTYLTVLVIMADRFDCLAHVQNYFLSTFMNFKYPPTYDKSYEETLRQKILIFYHTNQVRRLLDHTKELIIRGSTRWTSHDENPNFTTAWWDLPDGLESKSPLPTLKQILTSPAELAHRRTCILRTLASLQSHFLSLYTSRNRQCTLGYDSSPACDSFQLGEMIKFLTKKDLLLLTPFQATSPYGPECIWPKAYSGDLLDIVRTLRKCPNYQIDKNHGHCGLRTRIFPMLEYIEAILMTAVGLGGPRWKTDRMEETWAVERKKNGGEKRSARKPFVVNGEAAGEDERGRTFVFTEAMMFANDKAAKALFTAEKWNWSKENEDSDGGIRFSAKSTPSLKF